MADQNEIYNQLGLESENTNERGDQLGVLGSDQGSEVDDSVGSQAGTVTGNTREEMTAKGQAEAAGMMSVTSFGEMMAKMMEKLEKNAEERDRKNAEENRKSAEESRKNIKEMKEQIGRSAEESRKSAEESRKNTERIEKNIEAVSRKQEEIIATIRAEMKVSVSAMEENLNKKIDTKIDGVSSRVKTIEGKVAEISTGFDEKLKTVEEKIGEQIEGYRAETEVRVQELENRGTVTESRLEELAGKEKQTEENCVKSSELNNSKIDECAKKTAEVEKKLSEIDRRVKNLKNAGEIQFNEPEVRNVSFSGKERFPIQFLNIMREISESVNASSLNWIDRYLKEEAFIWWHLHKGSVKDFNEFEVLFKEKYFNEIIQAKVRDRLEFGRFNGRMGDEAISYVEQLMLQCADLSPPLTEDQLVYKAGKHFHPNILIAIITRGIKKKQEFIKLLMEFEHARIEQVNEREGLNVNNRYVPNREGNERQGNYNKPWVDRGTPWRHETNNKQTEWRRGPDKRGPGNDRRNYDFKGTADGRKDK